MHLVGMAGPSGSGKTSLCNFLAKQIGHDICDVISVDNYYSDLSHIDILERKKVNFDDPKSIDSKLLINQIIELKNGSSILTPIYNFNQHIRTPECKLVSSNKKIVFIEGIFALLWLQIRNYYSCTFYIELDLKECLERRVIRDKTSRGRSLSQTRENFAKTVIPNYKKFVRPTKNYSDCILSGNQTVEITSDEVLTKLQSFNIL